MRQGKRINLKVGVWVGKDGWVRVDIPGAPKTPVAISPKPTPKRGHPKLHKMLVAALHDKGADLPDGFSYEELLNNDSEDVQQNEPSVPEDEELPEIISGLDEEGIKAATAMVRRFGNSVRKRLDALNNGMESAQTEFPLGSLYRNSLTKFTYTVIGHCLVATSSKFAVIVIPVTESKIATAIEVEDFDRDYERIQAP